MDEPSSFTPEAIREKRAEILESLKPFTSESIKQKFKRGQYHGYKETEGVEENSNTETAFWLETELSHKNWQGIPLYIEAAKAVGEKKVSVRISFTDSTQGLFQTDLVSQPDNEILLEIEPKQSIHIALNAKAPGFDYELEQRKLSFVCEPERDNIHNAYERVLMDCIRGDQTLFVTGREVDAQWVFINSIFDNMEKTEIINYEPGTQSPFI